MTGSERNVDRRMRISHQFPAELSCAAPGVTMALPWLESLPVWGDAGRGGIAAAPPEALRGAVHGLRHQPRSLVGEGHRRGDGAGPSLEPLAPLQDEDQRDQRPVQQAATGVGIHPARPATSSPGGRCTKGPSCTAASAWTRCWPKHLGQETVQPSLVLGCEQPITGYHETNFSMAYSSHISWQSADSPVPMEVYPVAGLRQPVREQRQPAQPEHPRPRAGEAAGLRRQVSAGRPRQAGRVSHQRARSGTARRADARATGKAADAAPRIGARPLVAMPRPDNGLPEDIREHMRLMCDIVALAFQTDKTRIATLLLCRDISGLFYPFLDVRKCAPLASHNDKSDGYERDHPLLRQPARLPRRPARRDAGRRGHRPRQHLPALPLQHVVGHQARSTRSCRRAHVGGLGGTLETGRVLDYRDKGDENRKLCSLYLSLMDRMGVKLDRFGDITEERLAGL